MRVLWSCGCARLLFCEMRAWPIYSVLLLAADVSAFAVRGGGSSRPSPLLRCRVSSPVLAKIPVVDDVLDYLTNMGGYVGFTEDDLKGGKQLPLKVSDDFGKERETDDTVTTVFVLLLIATPFIVGAIGFSLGVFVVPSFVKF